MSPNTLYAHEQGFEQLITYLPASERNRLTIKINNKYSSNTLNEHVKQLRLFDVNYITKNSLNEISKLSLAALNQNKISFNEVISLHLVMAAWKEFILDLNNYISVNDFNNLGFTKYYKTTQGLEIPVNKKHQILKLPYNTPGVINSENFLLNHTYKDFNKKIEKAYGRKELEPILKKFFAFNAKEWHLFTDLMRNTAKEEQIFHLINLPLFGCYSPFLQYLPKVFKGLNFIKLFYATGANHDIYYNDTMVIPSFSAIQNFIVVKAHSFNRKPIKLIPIFGNIDGEHVYTMRKNNEWPLGLYYPTTIKLDKTINKHIKSIDGMPGNAFSFTCHDIYHVVRQLELPENITQATYHIVDLLKKHIANNASFARKAEYNAIDLIAEGALMHAGNTKKSLFFVGEPNPKFGQLFHCHWLHWTPEMIQFVIKDMIKHRKLWKTKFNLGPEDLLQPEQAFYYQHA